MVAACRRTLHLVASQSILKEYDRVISEMMLKYPRVQAIAARDVLMASAEVVEQDFLEQPICRDAADDKFLECALAAGCAIVSGDKDLLTIDGAMGVRVVTPRECLALLAAGGE